MKRDEERDDHSVKVTQCKRKPCRAIKQTAARSGRTAPRRDGAMPGSAQERLLQRRETQDVHAIGRAPSLPISCHTATDESRHASSGVWFAKPFDRKASGVHL